MIEVSMLLNCPSHCELYRENSSKKDLKEINANFMFMFVYICMCKTVPGNLPRIVGQLH